MIHLSEASLRRFLHDGLALSRNAIVAQLVIHVNPCLGPLLFLDFYSIDHLPVVYIDTFVIRSAQWPIALDCAVVRGTQGCVRWIYTL
jgi:hypothetical protein